MSTCLEPATTQTIGVYIINLDRRPDRWEEMAPMLEGLGVAHTRVSGVDAQAMSDAELDEFFPRKGPLGELGRGDKACTLSHLKAMRAFLATDQPAALILEDDVTVSDDLASVLTGKEWWPEGAGLLKLETYITKKLWVLLSPEVGRTPTGRSLRRLLSRHAGGAGYLIDRATAETVLEMCPTLDVPIDHLLFNANVSAVARRLRPVQVMPAMVRQRRMEFPSDIGPLRTKVRPAGLKYWWRESIRGLYEISRGPVQAFEFLFRGARLHRILYEDKPTGTTGGKP